MLKWDVLLLASVVLMRTCIDLSFKASVHNLELTVRHKLKLNIARFAKNPFTWGAIILSIFNLGLWTLSLSRFDLSYAYPFTAVCYILIILGGKFFFKEKLDTPKLLGMGFIILGIGVLCFT